MPSRHMQVKDPYRVQVKPPAKPVVMIVQQEAHEQVQQKKEK